MSKILAFDPGTNSLGMVLRDTDNGNLADQVTSGVDIFRDKTERDKRGRHHSAASQRRSFRNARTRLRSVKRRKQALLKLLIKHGCCPLDMDSLNKWRFDDDEKGYDRTFPVSNESFMNWINFEFQIGNEKVRSVYRLREILATTPLDYSKPESWLMLGRAIYSIAVRRGFKSSRLDSTKSDDTENDDTQQLQKSEEELSKGLSAYMTEHNCPTVGAAFARMERVDRIRIRANEDFKPIRAMLKKEIETIFDVQRLDTDSDLYKGLMSEKKHEGTIFYKNPLKSQKGKIEYCTLEPHRRRCPKSHPANEFNVAWQLLNNIKIKREGVWEFLDIQVRHTLYQELFVRNVKHFDFKEIREKLEDIYNLTLEYRESINYSDTKSVNGCPISHYLQKIFGPDWQSVEIPGTKKHLTHADRRKGLKLDEAGHQTKYTAEDIWHICYESDEKEFVKDYADKLGLSSRYMGALWENIQDGYSNLSLCALRKINPFLERGYKYSDAVMLANLPTIMGKEAFEQHEQEILHLIEDERARIAAINRDYDIANKLISEYKSLQLEGLAFAERDYDYTLKEDDIAAVKAACAENYGREWDTMPDGDKDVLITHIAHLYQDFFFSKKRDYYKRINLSDSLKSVMMEQFPFLTKGKLNKLYHHSDNAYYAPAKYGDDGIPQLGSPAKASLANPNVLKVLYKMKQNVNKMLKNRDIDTDTIVVVENAREALNDFNMRWAIEEYNNKREREHKYIEKALNELSAELGFTIPKESVQMARLALYQNENFTPYNPNEQHKFYDKQFDRYKSLLRQGFNDFYTGRPISLTELFSENNLVEVDHILPISKSFDDSISNKVLSSSRYNSGVKGTRLPCELPNYQVDTPEGTAIIHRIDDIREKVKYLENKVDYWKGRSSRAADPDAKNSAIKQMHLWQMEYDEWNKRLINLTATEITPKFRSSQLNDTRIISKYAYHYLKTVFGRVVVQRGETTAVFRKIFGFQSAYEKKDRSRHTHHAIDALTLSLIPYGPKRERMMELFYEKQEAHRFKDYALEKQLQARLDSEIRFCGLGQYSPDEIIKHIEETTLVRNDATNNALTKNVKRYRVRGKVVPQRDADGNVIYEHTPKGKRVKAKHVSQGNSIRGAIHDQTFYGKISKWKDDGSHEKEEQFVIRRKIEYKSGDIGSGFTKWEDLRDHMVDKKLFEQLKKNAEGKDFPTACAEGLFVYVVENGEKREVRVRHVRCKAQTAQPLKRHTFQPKDKHAEQYYYVSPGEAYGIFEYKSNDGKYIYETDNLFSLSQKMKNGELKELPCPKRIIRKGKEYTHTRTILKEDTILVYPPNEQPEDQFKLTPAEISKRLYRINSIELPNRIKLTRHNLTESFKGRDTITDADFADLPDGFRKSVTTLKFLLLGTDFDIVNGKMVPI
ncbi:MAG: hypothetical protein K6B13_05995 [Prevotella sp.]|nr:hypothetical protein [Prevotella sp.]